MSPLTFTERSREGIKRSLIRLEPSVNDCVLWCRRHWDSASRDTRAQADRADATRPRTDRGPDLPGGDGGREHLRYSEEACRPSTLGCRSCRSRERIAAILDETNGRGRSLKEPLRKRHGLQKPGPDDTV